MNEPSQPPSPRRSRLPAFLVGTVLGTLATAGFFIVGGVAPSPGDLENDLPATAAVQAAGADHTHRPGMIHEAGHDVMPFLLEATLHVFEMIPTGGIQDVVVRESGDTAQIDLIRSHLREEAGRFGRGDFSDPASLHGADMPGLAELAAGAEHLDVLYSELPDGARITYSSTDPTLITAIHRWFGAQLSDHATDATYR